MSVSKGIQQPISHSGRFRAQITFGNSTNGRINRERRPRRRAGKTRKKKKVETVEKKPSK